MAEIYRSPREAGDAFVTPTAKLLANLCGGGVHVHGPSKPGDQALALNRGLSVPLPGTDLSLRAILAYEIAQVGSSWVFSLTGYIYELLKGRTRVIGWHWHPRTTPGGPLHPHVHQADDSGYERYHFPTGFLPLSTLAIYLLNELKVQPAITDTRSLLIAVRRAHDAAVLPLPESWELPD